jgi:beta-glucosidase
MYSEAADVTIACIGLDATLEGEEGDTGNEYFSGDKKDLLIPESQQRLMEILCRHSRKLVTVIAAGSSLNVSGGNAKLLSWYPGQAGGKALAELLFGEKNPSGHLPVTFYKSVDDLPAFEDYSMENRTYRYFTGEPLYPFGHGLSYTRWELSDASLEDGRIRVSVHNTGSMDGDAVVQVYAEADSPYAPTHPRLCGFCRIPVKAGETVPAVIPLDPLVRTAVDPEGNRVPVEHLTFHIGMSQPDPQSVRLSGVTPVRLSV